MNRATMPSIGAAATMSGRGALVVLMGLFLLSGAAGLIYEVVWFQLLRLTIGGNSQSLGILLACFMGGLFLGSLSYARLVPARWNALCMYALLELAIAACGAAMPALIGLARGAYLNLAESPQLGFALRCVIPLGLLLPPTILMGATLPALARWVLADGSQAGRIGRLYAVNILGAVLGTLSGALWLLPALGVVGANHVAVGLNVAVAIAALLLNAAEQRGRTRQGVNSGGPAGERAEKAGADYAPHAADDSGAAQSTAGRWSTLPLDEATPIYFAFALNGAGSLAFEVVCARLFGLVFGATVYAFALVLSIFLLGLGLGGMLGSALAQRLRDVRGALGAAQLAIIFAVSGTSFLSERCAYWFVAHDAQNFASPWLLTVTNLLRAMAVVFPAALLWGLSFPLALACLGRRLDDAARPVALLYAFNTVGSVVGSLAASFVLIPIFGTRAAAAHLVVVPLAAAILLLSRRRWALLPAFILSAAALLVAFGTPWPTQFNERVRALLAPVAQLPPPVLLMIPLLTAIGIGALGASVRRGWALGLAAVGLLIALSTSISPYLYMVGRSLGYYGDALKLSKIIYLSEGTMEPVVVFENPGGSRHLSVNTKVQASTVPRDMLLQRLMGHLPVLLARDPSNTLVVALGAGTTAGAVALHDEVRHVEIVELERRVAEAAHFFASVNGDVLNNPKVELIIDDGRHRIATTPKKYGVITSDPVDAFMAGAAALFTVEHYLTARDKLAVGGIFCQWIGMGGISNEGMSTLIAAFADAFPDGTIWVTPTDVIMVAGSEPLRIDVAEVERKLRAAPRIAESLAYVGVETAENLLGYFLCTAREFRARFPHVAANRDATLTIQYTGWQAYYRYYDRDVTTLQRFLGGLRRYDATVFRVPAGREQRFAEAMQREAERYDDYVARLEERRRTPRQP